MRIKITKVIVSLALAFSLAAQPLATFPMNVFAGTGEGGTNVQGEVVHSVTIKDKSSIGPVFRELVEEIPILQKNLTLTADINANADHGYTPKWEIGSGNGSEVVSFDGATDQSTCNLKIDFSKMANWAEVVEIKVTLADKNDSYKLAVINAEDINSILKNADLAVNDLHDNKSPSGAYHAHGAAWWAVSGEDNPAYWAAHDAAYVTAYAATYANYKGTDNVNINFYGAYVAAYTADNNVSSYDTWVNSYKTNVDSVVSGIVADYNAAGQTKKDWLVAAYGAVKAAKKMTDGNGLDMEAKLKIAQMIYRIAQFTWLYNTNADNKEGKADECKTEANKLQTVIDQIYSDKVGDIAEQAAQGQG